MMLDCRASPNDFKAALSWSPAVLSIWRTKDGARAAARMAITARTPIISMSENARWLLRGAQPPYLFSVVELVALRRVAPRPAAQRLAANRAVPTSLSAAARG